MHRRYLILLVLGGAVFVAAIVIYLSAPNPRPIAAPVSKPSPTPEPLRKPAPAILLATPATAMSATPAPRIPLLGEIEALLEKLQRGEAGPEDLGALRERLLHGDARQAIAAIVTFLLSGRDAATGQEFQLAAGGTLTGAPTLRVFLMDLLGQISKSSGSNDADALARNVLETKTSPEEWALSLRNVAWIEPAAKKYLADKVRELLAEPSWNAAPSVGFLESFDVIVYTGDPAFIPDLADMARGGIPEIQRAALIALDRLSEVSPLPVMNYLNSNPGTLADRPLLRADYFSKADIREPAQRAAIESYLARGDVALDEKTKFLEELAQPGSFVSDTLLTTTTRVTDDAARQQNLSKVLKGWIAGNRFPQLKAPMQEVLGLMAQQ